MTEIILFLDNITIHCSAILLKFSERLQRLFTIFESIVVSLLFLRKSQRSQKLMSGLRAPWRSVNNKKIKNFWRKAAAWDQTLSSRHNSSHSHQLSDAIFSPGATCSIQHLRHLWKSESAWGSGADGCSHVLLFRLRLQSFAQNPSLIFCGSEFQQKVHQRSHRCCYWTRCWALLPSIIRFWIQRSYVHHLPRTG